MRNIAESVLCILMVVGVAALALSPLLTGSGLPAAADQLLFYTPWEEARPEGLAPPPVPGAETLAQQYLPWYAFISQTAVNDESVLWNPLENCGFPFLALWKTRCLSPFSSPFYVLPLAQAFQLSALLKLVVAGLGAFFLARRFAVAHAPALLLAITFQLSGAVYFWWCWPVSDTIVWLPLLILAADRLVLGQYAWWVVGALGLGLMLLGGDPSAVGGALVVTVLFVAFRLAFAKGGGRRLAGVSVAFVCLLLVALAIAAVQLLPYAEYLREAPPAQHEAATAPSIRDLTTVFFPHFFSRYAFEGMTQSETGRIRSLTLMHAGLIPALLLVLWLSLKGSVRTAQRHRVNALLAAAGAASLLAIILPITFDTGPLKPESLLLCNPLALGVAAAVAAQEWVRLDAEACKETLKKLPLWAGFFAVLAIGLVLAARETPRPNAAPFWGQFAVAGGLSAGLIILIGLTLVRPSVRGIGYGTALLTTIGLLLAYLGPARGATCETLGPKTEFVDILARRGARVGGTEQLTQWPLSVNGISQLRGPSSEALHDLATTSEDSSQSVRLRRAAGVADLILDKNDLQADYGAIREEIHVDQVLAGGLALCQDLKASRRAYVTNTEPAAMDGSPSEWKDQATQLTVQPQARNTEVTVSLESKRDCFLVLADTFYPGWQAEIDGDGTRPFRTKHGFMAVGLSQGIHTVVFRYAPASLKFGTGASKVGLSVVVLGLLWMLIQYILKRRRRQEAW